MWKRFNKTDRRILSAALLLLLLFSYLLYDDSLLFSDLQTGSLRKIGSIAVTNHDVRRKVSKQFTWKTARDQDSVYYGDSLFTGAQSSAIVKLDDGRELSVQQNSLVSFSNIDDQFAFDLQFGKISGEIKGKDCIKILVHGKPTEICGDNAKLELDADGSVDVKSGTAEIKQSSPYTKLKKTHQIHWVNAPPSKFFHFNHTPKIELTWSADGLYGRYHVQFAKTENFEKISYEQIFLNKSAMLNNYPKNGKFFVRILADDIKGEITATSPSSAIEIISLNAPVILNPVMKQTLSFKVDLDGQLLEANRAEIKWSYKKPSAKYELQIATDSEFKDVQVSQLTTETSALSQALPPGDYFVRVKDSEPIENFERPWSAPVAFTVKFESPEKLTAPVLLTTDIKYFAPSAASPKITWTQVPNAPKGIVEIAEGPDFSKKQSISSNVPNLDYQDYYPGEFYVRVFAATEHGTVGNPSNTGTLLIRARKPVLNPVEPKVVLGKSPEDPGDPTDFNVTWSDQKFADSYVIQVAKDPKFKDKTQYQTRTPASVIQVPSPGDFYWRVQGIDSKGLPITQFSEVGKMNYVLQVPLSTPELQEPLNNITLFFQRQIEPLFWLEWKPVRQASSYKIEISNKENFESAILSTDTKSPRLLVKEKLPQGALFWRVRATGDGNRISNWSPPRKMSIFSGRKAQRYDE